MFIVLDIGLQHIISSADIHTRCDKFQPYNFSKFVFETRWRFLMPCPLAWSCHHWPHDDMWTAFTSWRHV